MDAISQLAKALRCLPGVGPKSAQRMVYHLLKQPRQRGLELAHTLSHTLEKVVSCARCNTFTETALCRICCDQNRDTALLCVVDSPVDIAAIEHSGAFKGRYFVLNGKISPLDGLGPEEIGLPKLERYIKEEGAKELILALSPSIETQATVHFIHQLAQPYGCVITQLAHGIPSGGELEHMDEHTINSALKNRAAIHA